MHTHTQNFFQNFLTATFAIGAIFLAGCTSKPELKSPPCIYIEATSSTASGAVQTVVLPASKLEFSILKSAPLVPPANFLGTGVYEVGAPDERHYAFLAQIDEPGARQVYHTMLKARGKLLFLTFDDVVVGVHPITDPIVDGNIFFYPEVPSKDVADLVKKCNDMSLETNITILEIRKLVEKNK